VRDDDDAREFATLAIDELLRMHELAERMLHLNLPSTADTGSCDAVAVARDVIALSELRRPHAPLSVTLAAVAPVHVAMPADALKQVLLNLVQNACDAIPHNLALDIRIDSGDAFARIAVCDNGPGIPPELQDRIFDPFFTTRSSAGGIGLGLFLVEGIVRGHGGSVSLNAHQATGGACFELTIPIAHAAATTAQTERTSVVAQ
jgi:signal transduction histidine kinase